MKLTNEEVANVFVMYNQCQTIGGDRIQYCGHTPDYNNAVVFKSSTGSMWCDWSEIVILLTTLSKISDEHAIEVAKMYYPDDFKENTNEYIIRWGKHYAMEGKFGYKVYQYLISKSYAVPLFFSPGHWANAKTAIELGIAIEKI